MLKDSYLQLDFLLWSRDRKPKVKYLCMATSQDMSKKGNKNVDLMCLQPHYVETKMIKQAKEKKQNFGAVTVE